MADRNWDLNVSHKVRYFAYDDLDKVLNRVRKLVKKNDIQVIALSVDPTYNVEDVKIVWNATIVYIGTVTEDDNVES